MRDRVHGDKSIYVKILIFNKIHFNFKKENTHDAV